ncbi:unnamed protein product [Protopolystoma xenopodis]|uniref:Uncharacterized protein n=1 Tax=Protopolystoma xenopodis TaxID=117903 RepID=A0A448WYQ4_9PLAT|nr:unnamed protein product [Protopolystoma xenopodis]
MAFSSPFTLVLGMLTRVCHIVTQSSFPRSYQSLPFAPYNQSAIYLVQVFHSTPATPSVLLEALLPFPCIWVTNSRLKPLSKSHGHVDHVSSHSAAVLDVVISYDESVMASADEGGQVILWRRRKRARPDFAP